MLLPNSLCRDDTILVSGVPWKSSGSYFSENSRQEFSYLVSEGRLVTRTPLQMGLEAANSTAKPRASAVAMHKSSWLQSSGLPYEVHSTIQGLPFEGSALFSYQTGSKLHGLTDSSFTVKFLGLYTHAPVRKHCRPQQTL